MLEVLSRCERDLSSLTSTPLPGTSLGPFWDTGAGGHCTLFLRLPSLLKINFPQATIIPTEGKSGVVDMRWDGLSPFYLLVAYKSGV
jgi:hypothetical protein